MREINADRGEILTAIKKNRIKHVAEYETALAGYRVAAAKKLLAVSERLAARAVDIATSKDLTLADEYFRLPIPKNHVKDYDQVIAMLEASVDTIISIRSDEFACYVSDDWEWKDDFKTTTMSYSA